MPDVSVPNVRIDVTLTDQTAPGQPFRKSVSLVAAAVPHETVGMIRSSIQVPVASTQFTTAAPAAKEGEKESAGPRPVVSYNYRTMSLNLDVRDVAIERSRVRLRLGVEYSPVDEKTADAGGIDRALAAFASFQQTLVLVLEDGKPLVVAQSSDPVPTRDRKITLEAKATILK
ncbi:MAG: hypothetical protein ACE148_08310 [Vicinamibacterales bacterium]